ncbi:hypothetical protein [Streptomyces sp. NPDC056983]|uniref:hypothetical protein n=1 Tax=Streptomyces sp. NPDC056983 TaxID=3345987 RepID=UPI0036370526
MTAGLTSTALAKRFSQRQKTAWASYRNGTRHIPLDLLKELIQDLCQPHEHARLIERAGALVLQARDAREGRGITVDPDPPQVIQSAVKAWGKVIWGTETSVFLRDVSNDLRTGELRLAEISYTETVPSDLVRRYPVGRSVLGHFVTNENGTRFSCRYGQTNPWPRLSELYTVGTTVKATVYKEHSSGARFVELESGGVSRIAQDEATSDLTEGSQLDVRVTKFDLMKQLIDVTRATPPAPEAVLPLSAYPQVGERMWSTAVITEAQRGYLLVELEGYASLRRAALLHVSHMTDDLKVRIAAEQVAIGERIYVEVVRVAPSRRLGVMNLSVREVPQTPGEVWI